MGCRQIYKWIGVVVGIVCIGVQNLSVPTKRIRAMHTRVSVGQTIVFPLHFYDTTQMCTDPPS